MNPTGIKVKYACKAPYRISIYPPVPFTRILCPSLISLVAFSTPTTAGKPYSRAITAPWVIRPPTSVTRPLYKQRCPARVRKGSDQDFQGNIVWQGHRKRVRCIFSPSHRFIFSLIHNEAFIAVVNTAELCRSTVYRPFAARTNSARAMRYICPYNIHNRLLIIRLLF